MIVTIKYKLKPNKTTINKFNHWINCCRFLYNAALEERISNYKGAGKSISKYEQYNELPELKKDLPFMAEVYSDVLQEVLDRIDKSYKNFFNGSGFPKFQKKANYNSFTFKRSIRIVGNNKNYIKLPKIGLVKFHNSKNIDNDSIKTATIVREKNKWFIAITYEVQEPSTTIDNSNAIGIDVGVVNHSTLSNGKVYSSNKYLENNLPILRRLQRKLSRQKKGSNSYLKTKHQLGKLHLKISNQRKDYNHKISKEITDTYSAVYVEDLKISNMVKLNSTLSRRMLDNGLFQFRTFLSYKCKLKGKYFHAVNPAYTSQQCSDCGVIDKKSRISQSEYVCTSCGFLSNCDVNGSKNVKAKGISFSTKSKVLA